ncbi:MAG: hypothetical protein ACFB15_26605 [Cyclobacteriaceae bacterium]
MPFNLLLFPLVGGYYLLITSRFTKYIHQRIDRQRLIFNAVLAGIFLLVLATIGVRILKTSFPEWSESMRDWFPLQIPYTGTAILSFVLGILIAHISNLFINDTKALSRSIRFIGNELEQLVRSAFLNTALISFTMKSGKVYVGWPLSLPRPSRGSYLSVLPLISGYRDETQDIIFTTEYWDLYQKRQQEGEGDIYAGFLLVLSVDEITHASLFDFDIYERFNQTLDRNSGA